MRNIENKNRMLIVSNNPLSKTSNNGKTIASFIDSIPSDKVRQLYFNSEKPSVQGYSYFQLSDFDVLKGFFSTKKRGRVCTAETDNMRVSVNTDETIVVRRNTFTRIAREILWFAHWKSSQLIEWLDEFRPNVVFFVAGDSGFAYNIVEFIVNRYNAKLVAYITDDYIMPCSHESFIDKIRRKYIRKKMLRCIENSDYYFTISALMRDTYYELSGKKSDLMINATPSLYIPKNEVKNINDNVITFIYTGSLYYNRDKIIGAVADAAVKYNAELPDGKKPVKIEVYSREEPDQRSKDLFVRENCCEFCGSLNVSELKQALNRVDVLLFVESFDLEMREKTKYSLSTKVPEYMSVGKPIFAVGPEDVGSIDYLKDVAFCAESEDQIFDAMLNMLSSDKDMDEKVKLALDKFEKNHNTKKQKELFMNVCRVNK